ncbi:unnamed protein product [Rotaria sp. Silwood1]|nr:unnamed protein product [Rotaria sp. Silwood1]CAF3905639.1 unnamed protein product [Rotaria sp. Silwood1]CAF4978642.1 unnamed protein product [Rotaria sp. Silwood1]
MRISAVVARNAKNIEDDKKIFLDGSQQPAQGQNSLSMKQSELPVSLLMNIIENYQRTIIQLVQFQVDLYKIYFDANHHDFRGKNKTNNDDDDDNNNNDDSENVEYMSNSVMNNGDDNLYFY